MERGWEQLKFVLRRDTGRTTLVRVPQPTTKTKRETKEEKGDRGPKSAGKSPESPNPRVNQAASAEPEEAVFATTKKATGREETRIEAASGGWPPGRMERGRGRRSGGMRESGEDRVCLGGGEEDAVVGGGW